jgi:pimeloyl-ACP methyl ester carboxylesterase
MRDCSLEPEAAEVAAPTLLTQRAEDEYASLAHLDRIEGRVRRPVSRLVVPGGHSPHLEQAEAVVEAIAAFARTLH